MEQGVLSIITDSTAQYSLIVFRSHHLEIFSNSLPLLEACLIELGIPVTRTMETALCESAVGTAPLPQTGLLEVSRIESPAYFKVDCESGVSTSLTLPDPFRSGTPVSLDKACEHLTASVTSIIKRGNTVFDLTGGLDSRLIVAAATATGEKDWRVYRPVDGSGPIRDRVIRDRIIRSHHFPGSEFSENDDATSTTSLLQARRAAFRHQGLNTLVIDFLGKGRFDFASRVRGGGGEAMRDFYVHPRLSLTKKSLRFWKKALANRRSKMLGLASSVPFVGMVGLPLAVEQMKKRIKWQGTYLTQDYHQKLARMFESELDESVMAGAQSDYFFSDWYMHSRHSRQIGFNSQLRNLSHASFEPLIDPVLINFARGYSLSDRQQAKPIYDLMVRFNAEMAAFPVVRTGSTYEPCFKALPAGEETIENTDDAVFNLSNIPGVTPPILTDQIGHQPTELGSTARNYLAEAIEGLPLHHDLFDCLSREQLLGGLRLFKKAAPAPFLDKAAYRLLLGLIWINGDELTQGISRRIGPS